MCARVVPRSTACAALKAAWLSLLLLRVVPLPLDKSSNNAASASFPSLLLGASSSAGRSVIGGVFWRLRHHPFSDTIVAKSSLLAQGDIYSVPRIAELGNHVGVGFQQMLKWLDTLSVPQQVYAWKLFTGSESTQYFLNKFLGAEQLYEAGAAQHILQRLKFVLLDGKVDIPSTLGIVRLLGEAVDAYKTALFTFAGELSDAINRTDIGMFERKLQEDLPLLKEVLAGILSLCVRLDDNTTKEYRTMLGRWILKLFQLDSAALILSPLSTPEQILERKLSFGLGVDAVGGPTFILNSPPDTDALDTTQRGKLPAGKTSLPPQQLSAQPSHHMQPQPQKTTTQNQYVRPATFSGRTEQAPLTATAGLSFGPRGPSGTVTPGALGGDTIRAPSLMTIYGGGKAPVPAGVPGWSSTYALVGSMSTFGGTTPAAQVASSTSHSIPQQVMRSPRARSLGNILSSYSERRAVGSLRERADNARIQREGMSQPGTNNIPGTATLTSMAAILRAEAETKNSRQQLRQVEAASTNGRSSAVRPTYAFDNFILNERSDQTAATGRTIADTQLGSQTTETGQPLLATGIRSDIPNQTKKGSAATLGTPVGYTMRYLPTLADDGADEKGKVKGQAAPRTQPAQSSASDMARFTDASKGIEPLRAGTALSATELKMRLRDMGKAMQTSNSQPSPQDKLTEAMLDSATLKENQPWGTLYKAADWESLPSAPEGGWGTSSGNSRSATSTVRGAQPTVTSAVYKEGTLSASAVQEVGTPSTGAPDLREAAFLSTQPDRAAREEKLGTVPADAAGEATEGTPEQNGGTSSLRAADRTSETVPESRHEWGPQGDSSGSAERATLRSITTASGEEKSLTPLSAGAGTQIAALSLDVWKTGEKIQPVDQRETQRKTGTPAASATETETLRAIAAAERSLAEQPVKAAAEKAQKTSILPAKAPEPSTQLETNGDGTSAERTARDEAGRSASGGSGNGAVSGTRSGSTVANGKESPPSSTANGVKEKTQVDVTKLDQQVTVPVNQIRCFSWQRIVTGGGRGVRR